tara:strand:+ start:560 stop:886 length:327 start_codon:yes stop_codon:yes gene_type:complete
MEDYRLESNKFIQNGLVITERLFTDIERFKIDRITDTELLRYMDSFKSDLEKIKKTIINNPRYKWVIIQEEIDRLYGLDKNLTGMNLHIDWKDGGSRGFYEHRINPKQ